MAVITTQQITKYYTLYKNIEITFTKEIIKAIGLITQQIFLKCLGDYWPCIIYSSSMTEAKVIANLDAPSFEKIRKANNLVSLRFSFKKNDKANNPLTFFVAAKVTGFSPYKQDNRSLNFINLSYTNRPPDDLIEILGTLLEVNINSKKRKEERILITQESMRRLKIKSKEVEVLIQEVPRKGILRDLSFSGAKIIVLGIGKFIVNKEAVLKIELEEQRKVFKLRGKVIRYEPVESRKDLSAIVILFHEQSIPLDYKMLINDYLIMSKKTMES
ncbi:MAG: pilus assembly protein PilZ [Spirochaetes bacterium]|nr:MAG: pilus assembly protein PilZ [Spirochaetota bacterium]